MRYKFTEQDIDGFIKNFLKKFEENPDQDFSFNFSEFEWISNQNLLLITGIINYLYLNEKKFTIKLFKSDPRQINKKQAKQIVQLWETWKLYKIFYRPQDTVEEYIKDFRNSTIDFLKKKYNIKIEYNIFNRLGITPFVELNKISNYQDEIILENEIRPIYKLNDTILAELNKANCIHPFIEETLSAIITRELYENFLEHAEKSFFKSKYDKAFMSISLRRKLNTRTLYLSKDFIAEYLKNDKVFLSKNLRELIINKLINKPSFQNIEFDRNELLPYIENGELYFTDYILLKEIVVENNKNKQGILESSFNSEELRKTKNFFFKNGLYKNENLIQFSFLDFGEGIIKTLSSEYAKVKGVKFESLFDNLNPNDVLKFAFQHNTSRYPIYDKFGNRDKFIPRGLFDVLTIVNRYNGLLIVRSNNGKIIFNFSNTNSINEAFSEFGKVSDNFPGTFITIYIPALTREADFKKTVIKPDFELPKKSTKPQNISLFSILPQTNFKKENYYQELILALRKSLNNDSNFSRLNYLSFFGVTNARIIKKVIFFLLTDYDINTKNSVIIVHPPDKELLLEIHHEIESLNSTIRNFKLHPVPLIYFNNIEKTIELDWIGIFDPDDKLKLNDLLYEVHSLRLSDFNEPHNYEGNINYTDKFTNALSFLPKWNTLIKYYELYGQHLISESLRKFSCIKSEGLYLCNGNYYQNEFLQLSDLLDDKKYRDVLSKYLFESIRYKIRSKREINFQLIEKYLFDSKVNPLDNNSRQLKYIAVTSSSHKIIRSLTDQGIIRKKSAKEAEINAPYILFDNYLNIESDKKINWIEDNTDYILICDAISTGNLVKRLDEFIKLKSNSNLLFIAVLVSNLSDDFENTVEFKNDYKENLISLYPYPIKKKRREQLDLIDLKKNLFRINPYTNIPITYEEEGTISNSILFFNQNEEFLALINDDDIDIKFQINNNLVHPYYFNIGGILEKENHLIISKDLTSSLVKSLFNKISNIDLQTNDYIVFYPKGSGIEYVDINAFNNEISKNHSTSFFELERFLTESGWKFPHSTNYFKRIIEERQNVLIFEDGTCTGDSLIQMINEISYFGPNRIDLLCIISRVDDYKRELLSKLKCLKKPSNPNEKIEINIYFGSQWHIPTFYTNNNPYSYEIAWLKNLMSIKNTPGFILKFAKNILNTITPTTAKPKDYKYFPTYKGYNPIIPKKEILLTRNELGKIAGFRFYKESFKWYDSITFKNKLDDFSNSNINREFELLSMCFLYEPYLYKLISRTFPDIKYQMESFVEHLFFNDCKGTGKIDLINDLFYDWSNNKKDLVHLFFIVFNGFDLLKFLQKKNNFLLCFIQLADNNSKILDYILFKLSFYFTNTYVFTAKISNKLKENIQSRLTNYLSRDNTNQDFKDRIIRFNNFTETLTTEESFEELKNKISNAFIQIRNKSNFHNKGLNNDKTLLVGYLQEIGRKVKLGININDDVEKLKFKFNQNLSKYITNLLTFSLSYDAFFIMEEELDDLNNNNDSLRGLLEKFNSNLYDKKTFDYEECLSILKTIYVKYFEEEFFLYKTFNPIITNDLISVIKDLEKKVLESKDLNFEIKGNYRSFSDKININLPLRYAKKIFYEFFYNLRHSDGNVNIDIVKIDSKTLQITSSNIISTGSVKGGNNGSKLFKRLDNNTVFQSDYNNEVIEINTNTKEYQQTLIFEIL